MAKTPETPERQESTKSGLYRAQAKETKAENIRTDERVDMFARDHIHSQKIQLRVAAALVFFLVGVIVVLAGRDLGFSVGAHGLTFDGGATVESPDDGGNE